MQTGSSRPARILVLYFSRKGHTKAMADLVVEGVSSISTTEVRLKSVDEATAEDLVWWDGVAGPLWPEIEGKLGCAFSSSGGMGGGGELTCLALQIVLMNYGLLVF